MALPKRSRKAWIQFGIAIVMAGLVLVVAIAGILWLVTGLNDQNKKIQEEYEAQKAELEKKVSDLNSQLNQKAPERHPKQVELVRAVQAGIPIVAEDLTVKELPEGEKSTEGSYDQSGSVIGKIPKRNLFPGEVVTASKLINTDEMLPLEHGKRAITLPVTAVTMVDNALFEGAMVDILGTFEEPGITRTLLKNIKVVKVPDLEDDKTARGKATTTTHLLTLEVTPQQAEVVALAARSTKLHFTLRPFGETGDSKTSGVDTVQLAEGLMGRSPKTKNSIVTDVASNNVVAAPKITPYEGKKNTFTMEVLRGTTTDTQEFERISGGR